MPSMTLLVVSEIITEIKKRLGTTTYTNVHLQQTEYYILRSVGWLSVSTELE